MKISSASYDHYRRSIGLHNNHVQQNAPRRNECSLRQHIANQVPLLPQAILSAATLMTVIPSANAEQSLQSVNRLLDWPSEEHTGYAANIAVAGMSILMASYISISVAAYLNRQRERRREHRIASFAHFRQFLDVVDHLKNNILQQQPLPLPHEMDFQGLPLPLQWTAILREIFNEEIAHDEYLVPAEILQAQQAVAEAEGLLLPRISSRG